MRLDVHLGKWNFSALDRVAEKTSRAFMRKITILALMAGAIISAGGASAQGIYLDLGGDGPRRYRDYDGPRYRDYDGPRYRDRDRFGIGVTADTIGPADFGLLTDVRTVGPFKTASVSRIEAIEPRPSASRPGFSPCKLLRFAGAGSARSPAGPGALRGFR